MTLQRRVAGGWNALLWSYDFIKGYTGTETFSVCLTWRERQLLLLLVEYIGWSTRFHSTTQPIDKDLIQAWRDTLYVKLSGVCPVDCAEVIQCLLDDWDGEGDAFAALIALLIDQMQNNADVVELIDGTGSGETVLDLASVNLTSGVGCDLDDTFGFAMQLVEFIHLMVLDFFEILETTTNWTEAVMATLDEVPLLTEVTDFINFIQENLYEVYIANWDEALKIEYACELWCYMVREDCTLSWEDLVDYYRKKGFEDYQGVTIDDWLNFVILGTWESDLAVSVSHLTLCYVLMLGGEWAGISLMDIERIISSFFNDPNEDWDILCDTCQPWKATFDFTDSNCGWTKAMSTGFQGQGVYIPVTGWQHEDVLVVAEYRRAVAVGLDTTDFRLFETTATFDFTTGSFDFPAYIAQQIEADNDVEVEFSSVAAAEGTDVLIFKHTSQGKSDVGNLSVGLRCSSVFTSGYSGLALLTEFTVSGYGDIPAEITANATDIEYL